MAPQMRNATHSDWVKDGNHQEAYAQMVHLERVYSRVYVRASDMTRLSVVISHLVEISKYLRTVFNHRAVLSYP